MISATNAYKSAIVADTRRIYIQAVIDIIDPDIVFGTVQKSGELVFSRSDQLYDKGMYLTPYATLEPNRWVLNGSFYIVSDQASDISGQIGFVGDVLSGNDGTFDSAVWVEEQFSNVSILQACSVYFPDASWDGYPVDFKVEVKQGGTAYFTKEFTGNTEASVSLTGFTVNNPDAIRVTVTKWSLPHRRFRVAEILPGVYEKWDGDMIAEFSLKHQGDISCITLPYGTCTIKMDNLTRRFEPRNKAGVFQSIEERQGIPVSMGVLLGDGTVEYKPLGVFYQYSGGWKTGDNGITMQWDLVDIVGLLQDREFIPPKTLPTTLSGWVAALVAQLGTNFEDHYTVDSNYSSVSVSVRDSSDISGMTCGDILRFACMSTGTWPRADAETGYLAVEPLWNQGNKIDLDNLVSYPIMKANNDLAAVIFTLNDGSNTQYVVSGNSTASSETVSIKNPFIKTQSQALTAAKQILSAYGGNKIEITGRGDMSSEIGDVDTVWLDESQATTARRIQQDLSLTDGVLQNVASVLLQADGVFLFEGRELITKSGTWTAPAGATQLRLIIGQGGSGGTDGTDGTWDAAGDDGIDGIGGKIWSGTVNINPQQTFTVSIGAGGQKGQEGGETTFGQYSSANGERFSPSYTDISSGDAFGRSGIKAPLSNSSDGGAKGAGGIKGNRHRETDTDSEGNSYSYWVIDNYPGKGEPGTLGASGFVLVYWDKETS